MAKQYCCVCKNFRGKHIENRVISLHRLPSNKSLRSTWLRRLRLVRKDFILSKFVRLCSDHFVGLSGPRKDHEIPSIFPNRTFNTSSLRDVIVEGVSGTEFSSTTAEVPQCEEPSQSESLEPDQNAFQQRNRSFHAVSLAMHDYCGATEDLEISSFLRNQLCQTDDVCYSTSSTQTNEDFFQALSCVEPRSIETVRLCDVSVQTETDSCDTGAQVNTPCMTFYDIKYNAEKVNYYTGLRDGDTFQYVFDELSEVYEKNHPRSNTGRPKSLSLIDQFLMVLMRLRLGLLIVDLADRFHVGKSCCSEIINRWIDLMHDNLSFLITWPDKSIISATMPQAFKDLYPNTRVILDCTEIFAEKPYSLVKQSQMYSHYKSHITYKGLVGITPNGVISFVSDLWSGGISDKQITIESGILDLCEFGDSIMADKGFLISDLTTPRGIHLIVPPLKRCREQLTRQETEKTRRIANLRIHVERHMERVKNFRILQGIIPVTISSSINKIWKICNALTTLLPPLYPHDQGDLDLDLYSLSNFDNAPDSLSMQTTFKS